MRSDHLQTLRELYMEDNRRRHPSLPEYARSCRNYTDKTANGLTRCVIDWLNLNGHQAERINSTGRYIDNSRVVSDITGSLKRIGSRKWIPGTGTRGTADISATIAGRSVKIEVKMKDLQSIAQNEYQKAIEQAGGIYLLVHSFQEFFQCYQLIIQRHEGSIFQFSDPTTSKDA